MHSTAFHKTSVLYCVSQNICALLRFTLHLYSTALHNTSALYCDSQNICTLYCVSQYICVLYYVSQYICTVLRFTIHWLKPVVVTRPWGFRCLLTITLENWCLIIGLSFSILGVILPAEVLSTFEKLISPVLLRNTFQLKLYSIKLTIWTQSNSFESSRARQLGSPYSV